MGKQHVVAVTKRYAVCPHCSKNSQHTIDHLYEKLAAHKPIDMGHGGWECRECRECGLPFNIHAVDGELVVSKNTNPKATKMIRTWDLVQVITEDGKRLRLLLSGMRWEPQGYPEVAELVAYNKAYWYNEHTCPTNWTNDIVAMIEEDDEDPHGVFQFVATVDQDKAIMKLPHEVSCHGDEEVDLQKTFPEHFKPLEV
jgi:hypothetical protein